MFSISNGRTVRGAVFTLFVFVTCTECTECSKAAGQGSWVWLVCQMSIFVFCRKSLLWIDYNGCEWIPAVAQLFFPFSLHVWAPTLKHPWLRFLHSHPFLRYAPWHTPSRRLQRELWVGGSDSDVSPQQGQMAHYCLLLPGSSTYNIICFQLFVQ